MNAPRKMGTVKVQGDLGPVHLLGGPEGSPRVWITRHAAGAFVRIHPRIWGVGDGLREFVDPQSPSIERYAFRLVDLVRQLALEREKGGRL